MSRYTNADDIDLRDKIHHRSFQIRSEIIRIFAEPYDETRRFYWVVVAVRNTLYLYSPEQNRWSYHGVPADAEDIGRRIREVLPEVAPSVNDELSPHVSPKINRTRATTKKCPFCAEDIQDSATRCRYCGSKIGWTPTHTWEESTTGERTRSILHMVGLLIKISLLLLVMFFILRCCILPILGI
jgi:hypothetical protein